MPNDSKTYIVNDQATEIDALDFTPYVETLKVVSAIRMMLEASVLHYLL